MYSKASMTQKNKLILNGKIVLMWFSFDIRMKTSIVVFDILLVSLILFLFNCDRLNPPIRFLDVVNELSKLENFDENDCFKDLSKLRTNENVILNISHGTSRSNGRVPDNLMELFPNLKSFFISQGKNIVNFMDFEMDFGIFKSNNLNELVIFDEYVFDGVLNDLPHLQRINIENSLIYGVGNYPELVMCRLRDNTELQGDAKNLLDSVNQNIRLIEITKCPQFFHGNTFQEINFSRFTMLQELVISENNIECLLPAEMGNLPSIKILEIHGNKFIYNQEFFYNLGQNLGKKTKHSEFIFEVSDRDPEWSEGFVKCLKDYMNDAERYDDKFKVSTNIILFDLYELGENINKPFWEKIKILNELFDAADEPLLGGKTRRKNYFSKKHKRVKK